jgi:hypothetical protein
MKRYSVVVVKEAATSALTQEPTKRMEQSFLLYADSKQKAYLEAQRLCTLPMAGAKSRTFVDGEEYLEE